MPSPFPGMDPFLEISDWDQVYLSLMMKVADQLQPQFRGRYVVRIARHVAVSAAEDPDLIEQRIANDDPILVRPDIPGSDYPSGGEVHLNVQRLPTRRIVTRIEALVPFNKRTDGGGRNEYLRRRTSLIESGVNLVELDLLRGGERLPSVEPLPPGDYFVFASRANNASKEKIVAWTLKDRMPEVRIPLAEDEEDVTLDLQVAFHDYYNSGYFGYMVDYTAVLKPPLSEQDQIWADSLLDRWPGAEGS